MMPDQNTRAARLRTAGVAVWTAVGVLILIWVAGVVVGRISSAIVPFVIAGIIAFLLRAPVDYLEKLGVPRALAVILCFIVGLAILAVAGLFLVPPFVRQIQAFANEVPNYLNSVQGFLNDLQQKYSSVVVPAWLRNVVSTAADNLGAVASRVAQSAGGLILAAGTGVVTGLIDIFLGFVIAFWLLKDLRTMRRELDKLAGPRYEEDARVMAATINRVVGGYLRGQTIASLVTGTLATIGFAIIGLPYALVLGLITFVLNYIPYAGPLVAGLIAAAVGLFSSPLSAVLAIVVVVLAQNLTDNLVTPKVMSRQVNLHPTLVIFSLLVGASLMGIAGMLIAIPFAALVQGLFVYYYERQTRRRLASESGALFKAPATSAEEAEPGERRPSAWRVPPKE
jgi:predicted PurR-regulated permease PerM